MMRLAADMHIHTVLSPCASRDMTPPAIVREAARKGMAVIAVCDHNSAGNVEAVAAAAAAILSYVWQAQRVAQERDAARAASVRAQRINQFLLWHARSRRGCAGGQRPPVGKPRGHLP